MKAIKCTLNITCEGLSDEVFGSLILEFIRATNEEHVEHGELVHDDGDTIKWTTKREEVEI